MDRVMEWYEKIPYADAKQIIKSSINGIKREFISIGYYLKYIRDNQMYLEDGFTNIWEFAQDTYGISRTTASRWMSINDRFSKGGNSPLLDDRYRDFNKGQLQEMLYLDDSQIKQVGPDMTVKEIRELREPEVPEEEEQITGQMNIEDYPVVMPEENREDELLCDTCVNASSLTGNPDLCANCGSSGNYYKARCITGKSKSGLCGAAAYCNKGVSCCLECAEDCNGRCGWLEECATSHTENCDHSKNGLCELLSDDQVKQPCIDGPCQEEIQEQHDERWFALQIYEHSSQGKEAVKICLEMKGQTFRTIAKEIQKRIAPYGFSGSSFHGFDVMFNGFNSGIDCKIEGENKIHLTYAELARDLKQLIEDGTIRNTEDDLNPCLYDLKVKFCPALEGGADDCDEACCNDCTKACDKKCQAVDLLEGTKHEVERVADETHWDKESDSDIIEHEEISIRKILEEEKKELKDWEEAFKGFDEPYAIKKKRVIVDALEYCFSEEEKYQPDEGKFPKEWTNESRRCLSNLNLAVKNKAWSAAISDAEHMVHYLNLVVKREQPDLPVLKNNDQRKKFIDGFRDWPVWFRVPNADEVYYRYNLPDGSSMVICEYKDWYQWMERYSDENPDALRTREYLLKPGYHYLSECKSNISALVDHLKEVQKKG